MKRFTLFLLFLLVGFVVFANKYYVDPFPKSKMPEVLVFEQVASYETSISGKIKRAIQFGDTTVVLTQSEKVVDESGKVYEAFTELRRFTVSTGVASYLDVTAVNQASDLNNLYFKISDICRTQDGALVACNYAKLVTENNTTTGTLTFFKWQNGLVGSSQKWFDTQYKCELPSANIGMSLLVDGTLDECDVVVTAADASTSNAYLRLAKWNIVGGESKSRMFTQFPNADGQVYLTYETLGGAPYTLSVSPRTQINGKDVNGLYLIDAPGIWPTEFKMGVENTHGNMTPADGKNVLEFNGDIFKKFATISGFRYAGRAMVSVPMVDTEGYIRVGFFDVTNGFTYPERKTWLSGEFISPSVKIASADVVFASAETVVDGTNINLYLVVGTNDGKIKITKFTNAESASLFNPNYVRPAELKNTNCVVRVAEDDVKNTLPAMKVDYLVDGCTSLGGFGDICLYATDDDDYAQKAANLTHVYTVTNPVNGTNYSLSPISSDFVMKPGKRYSFCSRYVPLKAFRFDVFVVPSTVVWGATDNNEWHNDNNWKSLSGENAFIPLAKTNVIIENTSVSPILYDVLSSNATPNLQYNVGVDYNSCNNIYLAPYTELVNQHQLNYKGTVFLDIPFEKDNQWQLLSMPIKGVVTGDFYIPSEGDGKIDFAGVAAIDGRNTNKFNLKVYNSAIKGLNVTGNVNGAITKDTIYTYNQAEWSPTTNALNMALNDCRGYAVKKESSQSFVRLPKSATSYSYYYTDNSGNEIEIPADWAKVPIERTVDAGKFVYGNAETMTVTLVNEANGDLFLVGNPFVCDLKVKEFLAANSALNQSYIYLYDGVNNIAESVTASTLIKPAQAFLVKANDNTQSITITFNSSMMHISSSVAKAPNYSNFKKQMLMLTAEIGDVESRAYVETSSEALQVYDNKEDAELVMFDADLTPAALYTLASKTAVVHNRVGEIKDIPVALMVLDSTLIEPTFNLTFEGIDNFIESLYLMDIQSGLMMPLEEGITLELETPTGGMPRYYITCNKVGDVVTENCNLRDDIIRIVSRIGESVVYANTDIVLVEIYDIAGRMIHNANNIYDSSYSVSLPEGAYMMKVVTTENISVQKFIVR